MAPAAERHAAATDGPADPAGGVPVFDLQALFRRSVTGMALLSDSGRLLRVNPALERFLGYPPDTLPALKASLFDLVDGDKHTALEALLRQSTPEPVQQEFRHRDGEELWALVTLERLPLTGARRGAVERHAGKAGPLLLQVQDIGSFRQIRCDLEQSRSMLATLMSSLPGMAYRGRADNGPTMEFVSDGCTGLTGLRPVELTGGGDIGYGMLINPEDRESAQQSLLNAVAGRQPFQMIYRLIDTKGAERWVKEQGRGIYDANGDLLAIEGLVTDVTKSQRLARRLAYQAAHDDLTGLVNRREFEDRASKALEHAKSFGVPHALCYLDLDQFKVINDTAGHSAGDELLKQIAGLLGSKIRGRDTLARLGGDEFGLLLENCPLYDAEQIAGTLVEELHDFRFVWDERIFQVGVSIGLVPVTADIDDLAQLLSRADVACYTAKDLGRNRVHIYKAEDAELARRHSELERVASLRDALENNRLQLYRQPIRALHGRNRSSHYEILLRLQDNQNKLLPPGAFIPAAERYGLMESIDKWVIGTLLSRFDELFEHDPDSLVAINLSGNSLNSESLVGYVEQQLRRAKLAPEQVCFEITETAAVSNMAQASRFISEMKRHGCRFALDDFGSGLSSFAYLKHFAVDFLKIDGSFVRDMVEDRTDHAMVSAINQVGHVMGISTIAEYAESEAVIQALRALDVDYVQGYAVGAPEPVGARRSAGAAVGGSGADAA